MLSRILERQAGKEDETVRRGMSPDTGKAATPSRMTQKAGKEDVSATLAATTVETTVGRLPIAAQTVLPLPIFTDGPTPEVVGVTQTEANYRELDEAENVGEKDAADETQEDD